MVGGTGLAPARARAHEFLRLACMHSTTRRKTGADGGSRTRMSLRPPASRAGAYAVPPRPRRKWIRHGDLRSALPDTNGMRRFLRFAGMVETEGLAPPQSVRTARLQRAAIAALPRLEKMGGSGGVRTRMDTAYETVALLLCYRAKMVEPAGVAPA